jgi:hypothetical protein
MLVALACSQERLGRAVVELAPATSAGHRFAEPNARFGRVEVGVRPLRSEEAQRACSRGRSARPSVPGDGGPRRAPAMALADARHVGGRSTHQCPARLRHGGDRAPPSCQPRNGTANASPALMDRNGNSLDDDGRPICPQCRQAIEPADADLRSDGYFIHVVCPPDVQAVAPFAA